MKNRKILTIQFDFFLSKVVLMFLLIFSISIYNVHAQRRSNIRVQSSQISAGGKHTLQIRNGTLWAWGSNAFGEAGTNNTSATTYYSPIQIGTDTKWVTVSAGGTHSLAIKSDGTLWAWGSNAFGEAGTNNTSATTYYSPVQIGTDTKWVSISAGGTHSLAIKSDGTLWAWGDNSFGEAGTNNTSATTYYSPVQIGTDTKWITISAGVRHSLAIKSDGTLWAWGSNSFGEAGTNNTSATTYYSPVQIDTDTKWVSISAGGRHSLAIKSDGTLWAWGSNSFGEAGTNNTSATTYYSPVQIGTDTKWVNISAGSRHSLAIKSDGTLWSWGDNTFGEAGTNNSSTTIYYSPVQIGTDTKWVNISAGGKTLLLAPGHSFATESDGTSWAWGNNTYGEVGTGNTSTSSYYSPNQISTGVTLNSWQTIVTGIVCTFGIKCNGTLWAWGSNGSSQLGDGLTANRTCPVQIGTDTKWIAIAGGNFHTVGLKSDGTLWAWGLNTYGQLGDGTTTTRRSPSQIGTDTKWISITAGNYYSMAVKSDGTLWAWGVNSNSKLGDGTTTQRTSPIQIGTDTKWVNVVAGSEHTLGLKSDGTLWAWGYNASSQLGDGSTTTRTSPVQIGIDTKWISVKAGANHTIGLKSDGTLWAWGLNVDGQLGDGTTVNKTSPTQIGIDNNWTVIAASKYNSTVAIKSTGTLWAWGNNSYGQLGDATSTNRSTPVQIDFDNNWISIAPGYTHTVGIKTERTSFCTTGLNNYGQLGYCGPSVTSFFCLGDPYQISAPLNNTSFASTHIRPGNSTTLTLSDGSCALNWYHTLTGGSSFNTGSTYTTPTLYTNTTYYVASTSACGVTSLTRTPITVFVNSIVSAGERQTLFIKSNGTLWGCGGNFAGQLGNGGNTDQYNVIQCNTDNNWVSVVSGSASSLAIKSDGTLWAWGNGYYGGLGIGTNSGSLVPVKVGTNTDWVDVDRGLEHTIALKSNGTLWIWGYNYYGQLGDGTTNNTNVPNQVGTDTDWISIAAGGEHTIAIKSNGTLWAWGFNQNGQLGDGSNSNKYSPVQVGTDTDWANCTRGAGWAHTIAMKRDGSIWSWGFNQYGALGTGTNPTDSNVPVKIGTGTSWVSVRASGGDIYAIKSDGTLWASGANISGALGDGSYTQHNTLDQLGTDNKWIDISGGDNTGGFTAGIKSGSILCTSGENTFGQLNTGNTTPTNTFNCYTLSGLRLSDNSDIEDVTGTDEIKVFPNPNTGSFTIKVIKEGRYKIVNELGQIVEEVELNDSNSNTMEIHNLNNGLYSLVGPDKVLQKIVVIR